MSIVNGKREHLLKQRVGEFWKWERKGIESKPNRILAKRHPHSQGLSHLPTLPREDERSWERAWQNES